MRHHIILHLAVLALSTVLQPSLIAADEKEFAALKYRLVGPFAGGRVSRACGVHGDPLTYYAATASGGVWKSSDGGLSWNAIFDDQPTSSIGSIAVAPSDANVIYVGTGEANIRGNVSPGLGLFKSEDAGKTWKHVWKSVGQIGTVAVHPKNADICFAAVLGHAFGPNAERGVYRTQDGGKTWQKVLFQSEDAGASDVCIDPNNPRVIFAGFWQTRRRPWEMTSGGPGSDLFVSRDGGDTWTSLKSAKNDEPGKGLPASPWGKVGVAIAPSNSQRVYALIEAEKGGLYRSDDGGETWALVNDTRPVRQRAWYYNTLTVHPTNPDVVFAPNVPLLKSVDGGHTFKSVAGPHHGDHHDLWIDPANPERMINSNDGGVDITTDGGRSWHAPPLPISQCYHVSTDTSTPYRVLACFQDLGSASGPSDSLQSGGIGLGDWHQVGGGEAGFAFADPRDPNIVYAGEYGGIMTRYDHRTGQARNITINQFNPSGIDPAKMKYRFQWTAPILLSQHEPGTVYHAANVLFRTRDNGQTWEKVSGDLSRNDKQKQQWSGGPITGDNTGVEIFGTIFALAESLKQKGLLWAGTDDGKVHLTRDNGKTWADLTANIPELPDWGTVACIEASPHDTATAYLVVDNHRMDDYRPHAWRTTDFGKTWLKITDGLDAKVHLLAIREDPKKKGMLYLGTERGLLFSPDAGKTWQALQLNLPTVPVADLVVKGNDLVVGTKGRSIWILDDLNPVRNTTTAIREKPAHLFAVQPAIRWRESWGGPTSGFTKQTAGDNPARGAVVWFQLGKEPASDVKLEILDAKGKVIAKASGGSKSARKDDKKDDEDNEEASKPRKFEVQRGLNRFVWDLTHDGADAIPGAPVDMGSASARIPVAPGQYTVKLIANGQTLTQSFEVKPDPRLGFVAKPALPSADAVDTPPASISPLAAQESLSLRIRGDIATLSDTVQRIRAIKKQLALRKELLKEQADAKELLKQSEAFEKKLDLLEARLHNSKAKISYDIFAARGGAMLYSQFAWLLASLIDSDGEPTKAQLELATELEKELNGHNATFDKLTKDELGKLNEAARKLSVPELYVPPPKKPGDRPS